MRGTSARRSLGERVARRLGRRYPVGPGVEDALRADRIFRSVGFRTTLGYWEGGGDTAADKANTYLQTIEALAGERGGPAAALEPGSVSIKSWGIDPGLLEEIVARGRARGVFLNLDALRPEFADDCVSLVERQGATGAALGCAVPGRWRRSLEDARRLAAAGCAVRVVKGQWGAPPGEGVDPVEGFEAIVERLAATPVRLGLATHDEDLARRVLGRLRGRPDVEVELLWGLPTRRLMRLAAEHQRPVRLYVPFGHDSLPYNLSEWKRSRRVAWLALRDALALAPTLPAAAAPPRPEVRQPR